MTEYKKAIFAGGCFWCMVAPFDTLPGVKSVISGYTGGHKENPTYEEVCNHTTGHLEAVEITYDPEKMSYEKLLSYYWQVVDPTDEMGQFQDRDETYRPVIYYSDEEEKSLAEKSKQELADSGKFDKQIVVAIEPVQKFWPAEDYHQYFYQKNPLRYMMEEAGGRAAFIEKHWSKNN